jgi:hypothetical protein
MTTIIRNKQTFSWLGYHLVKLSLLLLLAATTVRASGCDEPFVRPYYVSRSSICVAGEYVVDSYAPGLKVRCDEMELDHLVSLRQAWESGVCGEDLKRFANDPMNLRPTYWKTNRTKGRMSPLSFSERLDGEVAVAVRRDALTVMRKYGIVSRRELFDRKYAAHILRMGTVSIPFSKLAENSGRYTIRKVSEKTVIMVGTRVAGTLTMIGGVYTTAEVSVWSYRHLFVPDRDEASKDRAALFDGILDEFE